MFKFRKSKDKDNIINKNDKAVNNAENENKDPKSVLPELIKNGDAKAAESLLDKIPLVDDWYQEAFIRACWNGYTSLVKKFIDKGIELNKKYTVNFKPQYYVGGWYTAISAAAYQGHLDIVKILIESGADLGIYTSEGTALACAADGCHLEIVKLLLDKGLYPREVKMAGSKAMRHAYDGMRDNAFAETNIERAIVYKDILILLLEAELLLPENDRSLNEESKARIVQEAASRRFMDILEFTAKNGFDLNHPRFGPLFSIFKCDVAEYLIKNGADVNARNTDDETPLTIACREDKADIAKILIENGADVNAAGKSITPLFWAAYNGNLEVVKLLCSNGAKVNKKEHSGKTEADVAKEMGHTDVYEYLMSQK